jgi:hypothetical protein
MRARKLLSVVAIVVCAAVGGLVGAGSAGATSSDDDFQADRFRLINIATDQCADLSITSTTGNEVVQAFCTGRPTQVWLAQPLQTEPYVQFINQTSGLCMDLVGVVGDGTPVVQAPCSPKLRSQHWQFVFDPVAVALKVVNRVRGQCLEVKDGSMAEGAPLQVSTCVDSVDHQRWLKIAPSKNDTR